MKNKCSIENENSNVLNIRKPNSDVEKKLEIMFSTDKDERPVEFPFNSDKRLGTSGTKLKKMFKFKSLPKSEANLDSLLSDVSPIESLKPRSSKPTRSEDNRASTALLKRDEYLSEPLNEDSHRADSTLEKIMVKSCKRKSGEREDSPPEKGNLEKHVCPKTIDKKFKALSTKLVPIKVTKQSSSLKDNVCDIKKKKNSSVDSTNNLNKIFKTSGNISETSPSRKKLVNVHEMGRDIKGFDFVATSNKIFERKSPKHSTNKTNKDVAKFGSRVIERKDILKNSPVKSIKSHFDVDKLDDTSNIKPKKKFKFKTLTTSGRNLDALLNDMSPFESTKAINSGDKNETNIQDLDLASQLEQDERLARLLDAEERQLSQSNSVEEDEHLAKLLDEEERKFQNSSSIDALMNSFSNENHSLEEDEKLARLLDEQEGKVSQTELEFALENVDWEEDIASTHLFDAETNRASNTKEFQKVYPHTTIMRDVLHDRFGLKEFRPNQEEIMNACLEQQDCFVLMPTGGGKSLCYQLPATLTPGVTIVISPLRALIADQVDKLNALDIAAAHLCSDVGRQEADSILIKLNCREPPFKLLYLTPEKISANITVQQTLKSLYGRDKLSRFVIDEAHCLSQWGHDFRPDYKQLSLLRKQFPKVPIMCLTATATNLIQQDVTTILNLRDVKVFITSFNRPNIKYEVIEKPRMAVLVVEITKLIKSKFYNKTGIIYCLCRKECDTLANLLSRNGVKARSYHAGMSDQQRGLVQRQWMNNECHTIVATIAFGMGIDKPDVRYVIHHSVPKSVEAFYQESGRAGRDGDISYSYLYYSYTDIIRLQRLMRLDKGQNQTSLAGHSENLHQMATYCENKVDCRRHLQLIHLGEKFDRTICIKNKQTTCDNCLNTNNYVNTDVTKECQEIGTLVHDMSQRQNVTMALIVDVYKGSKYQKIIDGGLNNHPFHGKGAVKEKADIQRFLVELVSRNIVQTFCVNSASGFPIHYIKSGSKYHTLFAEEAKITIAINQRIPKSKEPKPSTSTGSPSESAPNISDYKISSIKLKCHEVLLDVCKDFALQRCVTLSSIINLQALRTMSEQLPNTKKEFMKIQYVTQANYEKFGEAFLAVTKKYRKELDSLSQDISSAHRQTDDFVYVKPPRTKRKGTKRKYRRK